MFNQLTVSIDEVTAQKFMSKRVISVLAQNERQLRLYSEWPFTNDAKRFRYLDNQL